MANDNVHSMAELRVAITKSLAAQKYHKLQLQLLTFTTA